MKRFQSRALAALAALLLVLSPLVAPAGEVLDGDTPPNGAPQSGDLGAVWDGSAHRVKRGDTFGNTDTRDVTKWDWQVGGLNLRNNQPINDQFVSQIIDTRKFGDRPTLLISWPGGTTSGEPLYVGLDLLYSTALDSTSVFRFPLGGCSPRAMSSTVGTQNFKILTATPMQIDSTGTSLRMSYVVALAESAGVNTYGKYAVAPYMRVHIWTDGTQVNGVYAHLIGRP